MLLVLDDDDEFRTALSELLHDHGHPVSDYRSPADVPPLAQLPPISAVITDYEFGGGEDGLSFARRFNGTHPGIPVIMLTAYFSNHLEQSVAAAPYLSLLRKPLRYEDLHRVLHDLTAMGRDGS